MRPNNFVRLCGMILNPAKPSVLVENAPGGDLLTYLQKPRKMVLKVSIMKQMVNILRVMVSEKENLINLYL